MGDLQVTVSEIVADGVTARVRIKSTGTDEEVKADLSVLAKSLGAKSAVAQVATNGEYILKFDKPVVLAVLLRSLTPAGVLSK